MNQDLLREVSIEISELKNEFDSRIAALHRKLKIALGDTKPSAKVTEFPGPDGKFRPIGRRKK